MPTSFTISREESRLRVSGLEGFYPDITLIRGEYYIINVQNGIGNIVIQSEPGRDGYKKYAPSVSTRTVYGLSNNSKPIMNFAVPAKSAQDGYINMPIIDDVDFALTEKFTQLDNAIWSLVLA
jgi:hypothetical protein